jgi:hypothetical protein
MKTEHKPVKKTIRSQAQKLLCAKFQGCSIDIYDFFLALRIGSTCSSHQKALYCLVLINQLKKIFEYFKHTQAAETLSHSGKNSKSSYEHELLENVSCENVSERAMEGKLHSSVATFLGST